MTLAAITNFSVEDDRLADGSYRLQFITQSPFVDSDGVDRPQGSVQEFAATAANGTLTAPDIEVATTTDAIVNQRSFYSVKVTKTNPSRTPVIDLASVVVPWALIPSYEWSELRQFGAAQMPFRDTEVYTKTETIREIDLRIDALGFPDATTTVKGKVELAEDGETAAGKAVQGNDSRLLGGSTRLFYASRHGIQLNSNVYTGGGTSSTALLQDFLDMVADAGGGLACIDGAALTNQLLLPSNVTLYCPNHVCGLYLENGSNQALLRNANPTIGAIVDENIVLIGGTYNGNSVNQVGGGTFGTQELDGPGGTPGTLLGAIQMYGVRRLKVMGVHVMHSKTIAVHVSNAIDVNVHDLSFDNKVSGQVQQGGLQFDGPCSQITVNGLRGKTEDDMLALNTNDADWNGGLGPFITDGDIKGVSASNIVADGCNYVLRTFNGANRLDDVEVSNVTGTVNMRVWHNDPLTIGPGNIGTFSLSNVSVRPATAPFPDIAAFIDIYGRAERLVFRNFKVSGLIDTRPVIRVNESAQVESLEVDALSIIEDATLSSTVEVPVFIPIDIKGSVQCLTGSGWKWSRDIFLAHASDFLKFTEAGGQVEEINVQGVTTNRVNRIINHATGRLLVAQLSGVRQKDCLGGTTIQTSSAIGVANISDWVGDYCVPTKGTIGKKLGDAFPLDTTAPTFSAASATGGTPFLVITFSETINSSNFANGVTIKKNTVTQTISSAKRREDDSSMVEFVLSANIAGGDTVTWEYAAASGDYCDLQNNPLANVAAQAVSISRTGYVYDLFTAADGTAMNGRAPNPLNAGGNWTTREGSAALQTIRGNRLRLDATLATQSIDVDAGAANVIAYSTLQAVHLPSSGGLGIKFRTTDASNYWLMWLTPTTTSLIKVVAGVPTVTAVPAVHFPGAPYLVSVTCNGNSISGTVNGAEAVSTTDAFNSTATKHGVHALGAVMAADDFTVVSFS